MDFLLLLPTFQFDHKVFNSNVRFTGSGFVGNSESVVIDIHAYMHTYVHTHIRQYVHGYIHTYIHTYIRTYIHAYI